jgi:ubiquinone/menaquinone biosynthesis C-methylase UbiE
VTGRLTERSSDRVAKRYDRLAPIYHALGIIFLLRPSNRREAIVALGVDSGCRVLEVGCGSGANLLELSKQVGIDGHVVGTDISSGMLRRARDTVDQLGLGNVEIVSQDAADLPVDGAFDAVLFSLSYTVITDRLAALRAAWALLEPGGRLVIMDSGLPDSRLGRMLGPLTRALSRMTFLGDPHTRPWADLRDLGAEVETKHFAPGIYFVCVGRKRN